MALVNQTLKLEITTGGVPPKLHVTEYDENMQVVAQLFQRGQYYEIPSGTTAKVEGTLAGHPFSADATVDGRNVTFELTKSMTAYAGRAWTKIKLTKDGKPVSTCGFWLECDRAGVEAGDVIGAPGFEEQIKDAVDDRLSALSEENVKSAELDEDNVVSFKNSAGLVLFTLDLSGLGTPATYGNLVLSVESLTIEEGGTGDFTVALDSAPSANQIVYLAVNDATRLSVTPSAITFTAANYNIPQTVTVVSEQDEDYDDNEALITITSKKYGKQIVVTITDDDELYLPFGGKEVVSFIRMSTFKTVDNVTTYYDEANDETITQTGQAYIWPFKTGVTNANLQGTPTKARGLLEANTTGAYSLIEVWNGIAIPSKANNASGMRGINEKAIAGKFLNNSWESIAIALAGMKYRNTAGELATQTLAETASDVLQNELPFTTEGWTKGVTTTVFTATGEVVFYGGNVEVYRIAAPADFVSWDWDLPARSWSDLRYFTSEPRDSIIIVNDAVTPEDITKFYEHEVEANF